MNSYMIRDGYAPRLTPNYFADVQSDYPKIWQPDVLAIAAHLARLNGAKRLVDIGCGRATGLLPYSREFSITGVDYGSNIEHCRMNYDWGTWVSCDLENDIPDVDTKGAAIVCSDVVEHLVNPDRLLATIMMSVVCGKFAVITTPDRLRTYGYDHSGQPGNIHHVREWTLDEMTALLESCGLNVAWRGWTISNNVDRLKNTMLLIVNRPKKAYNLGEFDSIFEVGKA